MAIREPAGRDLPGAIVLGGALGSLAAARSLGRRGIPVAFLTHDNVLPRFSRYVVRFASWPGPEDPAAEAFLLGLAAREKLRGWVVIPGGDAEMRFVAEHHARLSTAFRLVTRPWDIMRWAYDKQLTYARAAAAGLDFPRSFYPRDRSEIEGLPCRFPAILKPRKREVRNAFTLAKAWRADDRERLLSLYDKAVALVGPEAIVVQELVPGDGSTQFSYAGLWRNGAPVASMVAVRRRQYPIEFGYTSTLVRSAEEPEVTAAAERFLRPLGYHGLVEIEFKRDGRDARFKLLDVNARIWNWLSLGAAAGVDFAYLAWQLGVGLPVEPAQGIAGTSWVHVPRDIAAGLYEVAAGWTRLGDWLGSYRGRVEPAVFAWDDPLPAVMELPLVCYRVLTRRAPAAIANRFGMRFRAAPPDTLSAPRE
ncbi:ATP-grasp domain-containing protein [Propylenella binzhouense]|uniref:ATP-grasp domain-containing protein n=1 Tax=Propylenella binzhouense TaxID=2555902 RepID=A0A964T3P2_9HYPH|nr:ATP-grasp domain-containing protein [Propylenella binzhouense]MYZ47921.1 ATP-grasp domain-containing protein [Propylenella binzhouense]